MRQIVYLGDIHGNFEFIKGEIKRRNIGNNEELAYIIQVGDFGIGFNPKSDLQTLELLNKFLKLRNIMMLVIHGNHDDPEFFKGQHIYSNLMLLEDYTTMEIDGMKYLFVGGAISVDRRYRRNQDQLSASYGTHRSSYWVDEEFVYDEEKINNITGVDIVITHTAPEWCYPDNRLGYGALVEEFANYDKDLYADLDRERENVTKLFRHLQKNGNNTISEHYYGHFHSSQITMNGYCNHYLLGVNEFR